MLMTADIRAQRTDRRAQMTADDLRQSARSNLWKSAFHGQMSLEYAVVVALVVSALIGMAVYMKRSLCGRWRQSADVFGSGRQYEPGVTTTVIK